ncbi:MAG: acetyl-CoA C-acyltransferase [Deltaproteobacteria bacterium]|nr:acetyl-CoA C-acyltransferase [Candidatus Anaeroferrophillacea bacterium]
MTDVVLVSACRTAIGAFGGTLKDVHASRLAAVVMAEAVRRAGIKGEQLDDVRFGCCIEPPDALNVARVGALMAGIPDSVPAVTINRVCISGMEAIISGMAMIQAGMAEIILAGGVEHMSGVPYAVPAARWGCRLQDRSFVDVLIQGLHCGSHLLPLEEEAPVARDDLRESFLGKPYIMGHTAEFIARRYGFNRAELDEIALRSNNNVERATKDGDFAAEIVPVPVPRRRQEPLMFAADEHFRPGLTIDKLAALPPAFVPDGGLVTAGNASGINDGAAAVVLMAADAATRLGCEPLARLRSCGRGGCHPAVMGLSPVPAVRHLLARDRSLSLDDYELIEVNEAFAAQYLACERDLGLNREITNVNGSGIGLGHPIGATGARLVVTLVHTLRRRRKTLGLATLCGGGGVSMALALEAL